MSAPTVEIDLRGAAGVQVAVSRSASAVTLLLTDSVSVRMWSSDAHDLVLSLIEVATAAELPDVDLATTVALAVANQRAES